jgi:hypothetical protein
MNRAHFNIPTTSAVDTRARSVGSVKMPAHAAARSFMADARYQTVNPQALAARCDAR